MTGSSENVSPSRPRAPVLALVGPAHTHTAYAMVNRHWAACLAREPELRLVRSDSLAAVPPADCLVFHDLAADFGALAGPVGSAAAAVRTWDFGPYPESWVRRINQEWAQLWVHSRWVAELAARGGVDPDKIRLVPLGIDEAVYRPAGAKRRLRSDKRFRFLFVGAPIYRKGVDVLLAAYQAAFSAADDTTLVIKANPREIFYQGQTLHEAVREQAARPGAPEIVLIDEHLSDGELAELYRAATVGVFPYRAEGFCLPILEAMACGIACIAPRFGSCLDYCTDDNALLMPVRRVSLPVSGRFAVNTLGTEAAVSEVDFCEPAVAVLAERMRAAYETDGDELEGKGRRAAALALARFTWRHSAQAAAAQVRRLLEC